MSTIKRARQSLEMPIPTTIAELWNQGWVAENEDQACAQAHRMFDLFRDKEVEVDRLEFQWGGEHGIIEEWQLAEPYPKVIPVECDTGSGWDGDVLYAMWTLRVETPGQIITVDPRWHSREKRTRYSLDYLANRRWAYPIRTTAPGIGTAEGFGNDRLVLPEPCDISESGYCRTHYRSGCKTNEVAA